MDSSRDILYNLSLRRYLTRDLAIDNKISKDYQEEIIYKYLYNKIYYELTSKFDIKIQLYSNDEYKIKVDDIKIIINKIFNLTKGDISILSEICPNNVENYSWDKKESYLWFTNISTRFCGSGSRSTKFLEIEFEINIELMESLLKYRNAVIKIQRNWVKKLYNPKTGIYTKNEYVVNLLNKKIKNYFI